MPRILVIDDESHIVDFLSALLRFDGYEVTGLTDSSQAPTVFQSIRPDLCILDFGMPRINGAELFQKLKAINERVEVVFLTGEDDTALAVEMMKLGAVDYLIKPVNIPQLRTAVLRALEHARLVKENIAYRQHLEALVAEKTNALNETLNRLGVLHTATLDALGLALDFRDQSTSGHSRRVAQLTTGVAERVGVSGEALLQIEQGAFLHDIGKLKIPDSILRKPASLTSTEWKVMRRHPVYGRAFLQRIDFLRDAADLVYAHHEKFDGTGYPQGLRGEAIPVGARCFAIVDAVDALIYERPYHRPVSFDEAASEIRRCAGSHFDPGIVEAALGYIQGQLAAKASLVLLAG